MHFLASMLSVAVGVAALAVSLLLYIEPSPATLFSSLPDHRHVEVGVKDGQAALQRFSNGLRLKTISNSNSSNHVEDKDTFRELHMHLKESFPLVHEHLDVEQVNEWSLLYKWRGTDDTLKPVLCVSHLDVVPVTSLAAWTEAPFSGVIKDGYVWGRGAQDVKITVFALLEAVTALLEQRFAPRRTLYLAFGHDEEVGGGMGAKAIAAKLEARGVQLEFVLDEGGPLLIDGLRPFVKNTAVALVGTAEKGYVSVDVRLEGKGGHSSLPPVDGSMAVSRLSKLLTAVDGSLPPAKIVSPTLEFLQGVGHASGNPVIKWVLSRCHIWLLRQLLARFLAAQPGEVAAAVRTTVAVTGITTDPSAGNVLPSLASARFNFRYLPGEEEDFAQKYLQAFLKRDGMHGNSSVNVHGRFEMASAVTPVNSSAFALVRQAILETLAKDRAVAVVPFLLTGGTDSKHYQALCGGRTLRFAPVAMNRTAGDLKRVHGIDERVSTEAFLDAIRFFTRFLTLALA